MVTRPPCFFSSHLCIRRFLTRGTSKQPDEKGFSLLAFFWRPFQNGGKLSACWKQSISIDYFSTALLFHQASCFPPFWNGLVEQRTCWRKGLPNTRSKPIQVCYSGQGLPWSSQLCSIIHCTWRSAQLICSSTFRCRSLLSHRCRRKRVLK